MHYLTVNYKDNRLCCSTNKNLLVVLVTSYVETNVTTAAGSRSRLQVST